MKAGIAGGGIMGRLLAYALLSHGHEVSVFDRAAGHASLICSEAAAGLLLPKSECEHADGLIERMGTASLLQYWPDILAQVDKHIYFKSQGSMAISHARDKTDLQRFITMIESKLNLAKTSGGIKPLNKTDIARIEPQLNQFDEAYHISGEGQLDNQAFMHAIKHYLLTREIEWFTHTNVTKIINNQIVTADSMHHFDIVFDCRGMGARDIFSQLHAVRGECIWLHAPAVKLHHPIRFMHPRYSLYVVPRPNDIYIIGASEIYAEDYSKISVRTMLELLTAAYAIHPGFCEARIIQTVTQCRPAFPHQLPVIRCIQDNVAINGLYRHGFLLAPALMMDVMRWLEQGRAALHYPEIWSFQ